MRTVLKFTALSAVLAGNFSCQSKVETINPIMPSENIIVFFEEHLPVPPFPKSECFFVDENLDKSIIINSEEQFRNVFSCSAIILPAINFDLYTLIIGQHQMPNIYYYVVKQNITIESNTHILNLTVDRPDGVWPSFSTLYYWGIYPKMQNKSISVNLIHQRK